MSDEFGPNFVTVIDDETGEEIELEFIDALEHEGVIYRAFFPVAPEDEEVDEEEYGLIILKAETVDGEEMLVEITDEDELNTVYDKFMEQILEDEED
jgi:UDP-glucose 6-dehydrogenase